MAIQRKLMNVDTYIICVGDDVYRILFEEVSTIM